MPYSAHWKLNSQLQAIQEIGYQAFYEYSAD